MISNNFLNKRSPVNLLKKKCMHSLKDQTRFIFGVISLLLVSLYGCKKTEIKGPQGDPGVNVNGGNSNITSSKLFVIDSLDWQYKPSTYQWEVVSTQTLINQNILDKGVVKLYMQVDNYWAELPYATGDQIIQFAYKLNQIRFELGESHGGAPPRPATAKYRLVVFYES